MDLWREHNLKNFVINRACLATILVSTYFLSKITKLKQSMLYIVYPTCIEGQAQLPYSYL
jgi:hypothetical protein